MLTNKDYCDYNTSRELKKLGFVAGLGEDNCGYCLYDDAWHDQVDRPLLYEAQKWLREEKGLHIEVFFSLMDDKRQLHYDWHIVHNIRFDNDEYTYDCDVLDSMGSYKSYEEALSEGIKETIKILKNENNL